MGKRIGNDERWTDYGHSYAVAMTELRRSGAAGKHDPRENRKRTRSDAKRAAIREGW